MLKNREAEITLLVLVIRHMKGLIGAIEKYLEALKQENDNGKT
jgi:hypothetical protein